MRTIVIINLTAALLLFGVAGASAASKNAACDQDSCMASCAKNGGQLRYCPKYCADKINGNPKCK